jgi:cobalt-precorrin-5B (C1)-methyltransferase
MEFSAGNREEGIKDPVSGFEYPQSWIDRCRKPELLPRVARGLAILTSDGTVLMRGYTTGTTAAAACKAAVLSLQSPVAVVSITTPSTVVVEIPVCLTGKGSAECRKYAGDYPDDVTAGILFRAVAGPAGSGITIHFGQGIGRFSIDTPRYAKGEPAIGGPSMACITGSIQEALDMTGLSGVLVELSVPEGEVVAKKTLNPRLGITGGISVLGTTGLVEPWDDHLEETILTRVRNAPRVVLTTGRIGLRYARLFFPDHEAVLVGSKIGATLSATMGEVVLLGLPGLILRYINPGILEGSGCRTVEELMIGKQFDPRVRGALDHYKSKYPDLRIVLINRDGKVTHDTAGILA